VVQGQPEVRLQSARPEGDAVIAESVPDVLAGPPALLGDFFGGQLVDDIPLGQPSGLKWLAALDPRLVVVVGFCRGRRHDAPGKGDDSRIKRTRL
jgi:hypothetical protein